MGQSMNVDSTLFTTAFNADLGQTHTTFTASDLNLDGVTNQSDMDLFTAARTANARRPGFENLLPDPSAPYDVKARPSGQNSIQLTWSNVDPGKSVVVERAIAGNTSWSQVATLAPGTTSYEDKNLLVGRAYSYCVSAYDDGLGYGGASSAPVYASTTSPALEQSALHAALREVAVLPPSPASGTDGFEGMVLGFQYATLLPWTNLGRIRATFVGDMAVTAADLTIKGAAIDTHEITDFERTYSPDTGMTIATWTVPTLNALAPQLAATKGEKFLLEFHNSIHPTGAAGFSGPDFQMNFRVLAGDVGRNGTVTSSDSTTFGNNYAANRMVGAFHLDDLNLDGQLTSADQAIVNAAIGTAHLPGNSPEADPSAPWNVAALVEAGNVMLTWQADASTAQVLVQRAAGMGSDFATIATLDGAVASFADPGLLRDASCTYRLISVTADGVDSAPSIALNVNIGQQMARSTLVGVLTGVALLQSPTEAGGYPIHIDGQLNPTLPWSTLSAVQATFAGNINVAADDLSIRGATQTDYPSTAFSRQYDPAADVTTVVWTVPSLAGAGISDRLTLQFHSTIGALSHGPRSGADFVIPVALLTGDITGDGIVDAADAAAAAGRTVDQTVGSFDRSDADLNGIVSQSDLDYALTTGALPEQVPTIVPMAPDAPIVTRAEAGGLSLTWHNNVCRRCRARAPVGGPIGALHPTGGTADDDRGNAQQLPRHDSHRGHGILLPVGCC